MRNLRNILALAFVASLSVALTSCITLSIGGTTASHTAAYSDDLYGTHDRAAIAAAERALAEQQAAEAAERERRINAMVAASNAEADIDDLLGDLDLDNPAVADAIASGGIVINNNNTYNNIYVDDYQSAYERRLRGFSSPSYKMPSSYYNYRYGDAYFLTLAYDPAFYTVMVMGDQVWVEPRYVTAMFGGWGCSYINYRYGYPYYGYGYPYGYYGPYYDYYWGWGPSYHYGYYDPFYYHHPWYGPHGPSYHRPPHHKPGHHNPPHHSGPSHNKPGHGGGHHSGVVSRPSYGTGGTVRPVVTQPGRKAGEDRPASRPNYAQRFEEQRAASTKNEIVANGGSQSPSRPNRVSSTTIRGGGATIVNGNSSSSSRGSVAVGGSSVSNSTSRGSSAVRNNSSSSRANAQSSSSTSTNKNKVVIRGGESSSKASSSSSKVSSSRSSRSSSTSSSSNSSSSSSSSRSRSSFSSSSSSSRSVGSFSSGASSSRSSSSSAGSSARRGR